jgi:hypothetical protein
LNECAIGSFGGLNVLPGDQRQQRQRLRSPLVELRLGQRAHDRGGIAHQRRHQCLAGLVVVPSNIGLARVVAVVSMASGGDDLRGTGHFAANPTDRGDQPGDGVLQ